jgi:MFS family permease
LGAFITSMAMTRFSLIERRGRLLCLGTLGFAGSFVVFAIPTVPTAIIGNLGLGISLALAQISSMTLIQNLVPNEVRGRVMSILQLNMGFAQLMTLPLAGVAQAASLRTLFPILAGSVICIVLIIVVTQRHLWAARTRPASRPPAASATTAAR